MKPRVVMLIWDFWPGREGGAQRQCRKLTTELARRGLSCEVVTQWPGRGVPRDQRDGSYRIRRLGSFGPAVNLAWSLREKLRPIGASGPGPAVEGEQTVVASPPRRLRFMAPFLWLEKLFFLVETTGYLFRHRRNFDILHVHEAHWLAGFGAWLGHICRLPVLCKEATFPAFGAEQSHVPFASRWRVWRRSPWYQAITDHIAEDLGKKGIPLHRIRTIPNGVELPAELAPVERNERVLYMGNLTQKNQWKAFDILFDLWNRVGRADPTRELLVVGRGNAEPWRAFLRREGCMAPVLFVGFSESLADWYAQAAVFILPSRQEGLSNALLEAQSWGIPAVVSDIPGNRAVIEHGVNGLVVPVNDAASFAEAVLRLLRDPDLRKRMGAAARARIEARFSMERVVTQLLDYYRFILGHETAPRGSDPPSPATELQGKDL